MPDYLQETVSAAAGRSAEELVTKAGGSAGAALLASNPYFGAVSLASDALKGSGGGPSEAAARNTASFNNSGFTVATGSARASSSALPSWLTYVLAGAAVLGVVLLWKK